MSRSLQSSIHHDYRILVLKCFENTNILPAYVLGDSRPYRINEDAIKAIKDELLTGRGASVGYYADQSRIELRHLITELKCFEYYETGNCDQNNSPSFHRKMYIGVAAWDMKGLYI